MPAECEKAVANGRPCGVAAIGRCSTCSDAFCLTHQARDLGSIGSIIRTYTDWCLGCQTAKADAERAAAQALAERQQAERREALARLPELLTEFKRRPFSGEPRDWTEENSKGPKFFGGGDRIKRIEHTDEPAVRLGQLRWTFYYNRTHPDINEDQQSAFLDTGLTSSGELVEMDVEPMHSRWGNHDYKLASFQEVKICQLLERILRHS